MSGDAPPAHVWLDERRVETLEAAVDRLTRNEVGRETQRQETRERFFTAFARLDRVERGVALLLAHFGIEAPK